MDGQLSQQAKQAYPAPGMPTESPRFIPVQDLRQAPDATRAVISSLATRFGCLFGQLAGEGALCA